MANIWTIPFDLLFPLMDGVLYLNVGAEQAVENKADRL